MDVNPVYSVPTIHRRQRIPQAVIDAVVKEIAEKFHPQRIILFGSYAYGSPRPESDLDLLVIMDTSLTETEQAIQIRQELQVLFGFDILVYTPENLKQRIELGDSFLTDILNQGVLVYESTNS
jgi:predicted nucleotidyltransferase